MKIMRLVVYTLCIGMALGALAAPQKSGVPINRLKKPPVLRCPDVIIDSFTVRLVSTQVGMPGKEFPTDTVRLRAVLKNAGNLALPSGTFVYLYMYRNDVLIKTHTYQNILGAPGSTWAWDCTDTFTHGAPTAYMVWASLNSVPECSAENNTARLTIQEALLHAAN